MYVMQYCLPCISLYLTSCFMPSDPRLIFRSVLKSPPATVTLKLLKNSELVFSISASEDAVANHPTSICVSALAPDTDLVAASAPDTSSVGVLASRTERPSTDDVITDDQRSPCAPADIFSNPIVVGAGMRAPNDDEFGLSATQRRLQIQAMAKLQQRFTNSRGNHSTELSVGSELTVARKRALDECQLALSEIDSDASTTLNASDSTPTKKTQISARYTKKRTSLRSNASLSHDIAETLSPPFPTSLVYDSQSTCNVIPEESLDRTLCDLRQTPNLHQQNVKKVKEKSKGRKLDWPTSPCTSTPCQAGCENSAVAHYSCSHNFCDKCLVGIRRNQKTKKSEAEQLYCLHLLPPYVAVGGMLCSTHLCSPCINLKILFSALFLD
jgi:hypothetical protein